MEAPVREPLVVNQPPHPGHTRHAVHGRVRSALVEEHHGHVLVAGKDALGHLAVAGLEDVERQQGVGEEDSLRQGKERQLFQRARELGVDGRRGRAEVAHWFHERFCGGPVWVAAVPGVRAVAGASEV